MTPSGGDAAGMAEDEDGLRGARDGQRDAEPSIADLLDENARLRKRLSEIESLIRAHSLAVFEEDLSGVKPSDTDGETRRFTYFDSRTGLPSSASMLRALDEALQHRGMVEWCALVSISLDDLTAVGDAFGYAKGEALLRHASSRLRKLGAPVRVVGHLSTGVFGLLLGGLGCSREEAEAKTIAVAERALASICGNAVLGGGVEIENTATAGLRMYRPGEDGLDAAETIKSAEIARKRAFETRSSLGVFDQRMFEETKAEADLLLDLRRGIADDALCLYLQPIVDARRRIVSYEGLVRWMDGKRGLVPPAEFIPLAERTGLIEDIGAWVLEEACRTLSAWKRDPETRDLRLAINVSERQLHRADFADVVGRALARNGAPADKLRIELTESTLQSNIAQGISTLQALHEQKVLVALDDFGTGYSSLSYLRQLPVQQLKIDRSFVKEIATDPLDSELVRSIVHIAHYMGLSVVAEGVENEAQFAVLKSLGIDAFQGFLFGRPRYGTLPAGAPGGFSAGAAAL